MGLVYRKEKQRGKVDDGSHVVPGSGLKVVFAEFGVIPGGREVFVMTWPVILSKLHARRVKILSGSCMMVLMVHAMHTGTEWCFVYCACGRDDPSASAGVKRSKKLEKILRCLLPEDSSWQ